MAALKRSEMLVIGAAVTLCVAAAFGALGARSLLASQQMPIRWIEAQGAFERVTAQQIQATAAPLLTGGFFGVDLERLRQGVEDIPWIRSAGVQRQWPDKVLIRVIEHQPLGQWGKDRLVSDAGEIFEVTGGGFGGLVALSGPEERAPEVVSFYRDLSERLQPTGLDVAELTLSDRGAWQAGLTGGIKVLLGSSDLERRTDRLVVALDRLLAENPGSLRSVDLRYTNGLAVRWRDDPVLVETTVNE